MPLLGAGAATSVGGMKGWLAAVLAAVVLGTLPATSAGGAPRAWPTFADVRANTPGLGAKDAQCVARYYRGRLSRKAYLTPYYDLTQAEKATQSKGFDRCLGDEARLALLVRAEVALFVRYVAAPSAELRCAARAFANRREAAWLSITSRAEWIRRNDPVYRACRVTGLVYAVLAKASGVAITQAEQACMNRLGSAEGVLTEKSGPTGAQRKVAGVVFDRCIGRASKRTFLRRLFKDLRPAGAIPCVVNHAMAITFLTFYTDRAEIDRQMSAAESACRVP